MAKPLTVEQLKAMTMEQRYVLYGNALKQGTPEAKAVIELLSQHHLLGRIGGGLPREHPIIREIEDVVRSSPGRAAAKASAEKGLAALAGVDPLIQERLGQDYGGSDTTNWAGFLIAEVMEEMGYARTGKKGRLPPECVAKSAEIFVRV
ncbi:MAG TPA: hypothetical protein VME40_05000 [Caulobacteraceae bacterium]|nr:hypothetical protein [Caulobacteraceae bacterium]